MSNDIRANVEVNNPRILHAEPRLIDIDQVHELAALALRLEALSAAHHKHHTTSSIQPMAPVTVASPAVSPSVETSASPKTLTIRTPTATNTISAVVPPVYLGPAIREDMTDEELAIIIESLTTRIENTMSTLVCFSVTMTC